MLIVAMFIGACAATVTPSDASQTRVDVAAERVWCNETMGWTCYPGRGPNPGFSGPWCCPDARRNGGAGQIEMKECREPIGVGCGP